MFYICVTDYSVYFISEAQRGPAEDKNQPQSSTSSMLHGPASGPAASALSSGSHVPPDKASATAVGGASREPARDPERALPSKKPKKEKLGTPKLPKKSKDAPTGSAPQSAYLDVAQVGPALL